MTSAGGDQQRSDRKRRILDGVVRLRRARASTAAASESPGGPATELEAVHTRLAHVEASLEALQDQVYRDARRHESELAEICHAIQPETMARALSGDARRRGL
jgi:alkylation response protein AidB-like acyl-CoA dehydrogenase